MDTIAAEKTAEKTDWMRRIEFFNLARQLEKHHNLFYEMWTKGMPVFDSSIPTAAMMFELKELRPVKYVFNPEFWDSLDDYNRSWVVVHETLHALLNHGARSKKHMGDPELMLYANKAQDLSINHLTLNSFGYDREKIDNWQEYCWVDTVFPEREDISDCLSFEEYFDLILENKKNSESDSESDGDSGGGSYSCNTVDDHSKFTVEDITEIINKIAANCKEDADDARKKIEQSQGSGSTGNALIVDEHVEKIKPSKAWEKVVKRWKHKGIIDDAEGDQWVKQSRRYNELPEDFCLPTEDSVLDPNFAPSRIKIALFMDISGSCVSYVKYFLSACKSIPDKRFIKNTFVFDTSTYKIDVNKYMPRSGGGTSFYAVNDTVKELTQNGNKPDLIFMITDGEASHPKYDEPEKWHWFIVGSEYNGLVKKHIPDKCHVYNLKEFFIDKTL